MKFIDLSSDVVTLPTSDMREAIYCADLGDDAAGLDPTVNRLQEMAADRLGKEAALLVSSGTMGNLLTALANCGRGEGFVVGSSAHMHVWEPGIQEVVGIVPVAAPNRRDGTLDLDSFEHDPCAGSPDLPQLKMLTLENSHNRCGGVALHPDRMKDTVQWARHRGLRLHMDGSRIFNSSVALGVRVSELARAFDSVMFCLSKGLSCPLGSLICGDRDFIKEARRLRTMIGGDLRQAGIIAAAGIVALENEVDRLQEDHDNAKYLAKCIEEQDGFRLAQRTVDTNILRFLLVNPRINPETFVRELAAQGLGLSMDPSPVIRAVTHRGIERGDVEVAMDLLVRKLKELTTLT